MCARRARSSFAARCDTSRSTRISGAARISTSSASNLHVVLCLPARTRRSSVVSMLTAGSYVAREASDARGIGRVAWRERRDFVRREFGTPHLIFCSTARRPSAGRRRLRSLHSLVFARVQGWPGRARLLPWWRPRAAMVDGFGAENAESAVTNCRRFRRSGTPSQAVNGESVNSSLVCIASL